MSKAGIEVIVQPSFWLGSARRYVGTFEDYYEHMITFETKRSKEFWIEHFVCISVNPKEAIERPLALDAVDGMVKKGSLYENADFSVDTVKASIKDGELKTNQKLKDMEMS
jgi:uncharacterized protein